MKNIDAISQKDQKYLWIIGGGILQVPLITEARKLNLKIIVTDANKKCICKNLSDIFKEIDIFDIKSHIRFADRLIKDEIKIQGVLAAGIDAPETMSRVSEHLNLPCVSSSISHLVNHKDLFREEMKKLKFPVPFFKVVSKKEIPRLEGILNEVGYPLIIKNTSSSGSRGTKFFYEPDLAGIKKTIMEAIKVSRSSKALIESVWTGTEHTVETIFDINGNFHECFITDRLFDKTKGFAMETGLIHPTLLKKEDQKKIYDLAKNISDSLGIKIGAAKFDLIMTEEGPRIIEMTVRLSGGFDCQFVVPAATGKNILKCAILTACGEKFDKNLLVDYKNRVCISESLWPNPGKITRISGLDEVKSFKGFEFMHFRYEVGDIVEPYTDCTKRVCFILASGSNLVEANQNMKYIKSKLIIETEPK